MKIVCSDCRYVGEAVEMKKGSRKKEIALWCCLFLPGLFYTLWRQSTDGKYLACPQCTGTRFRTLKRREWKEFERKGSLPT
ncbi:hypothetical protein SAMN02746041_01148 [Desulfacinum hydrothermale DSM 13146]|uniref:LITAF-like zinc ribbon domain-containing protein n=1 Tax=Desulfacinum hydrothermale DSM 13146 TaxID=1121390 RepID=A0A1W1XB96_9BACT|nr:hypothetical protein [Desulfacinum hydrothermale]SMC21192.1 hypothetical protein SAMN02746041_01148 [Desulfacinum hydrothermale DSM 13146]